ncbi:RusA family crossover junction endodeoxyribonuclease [Paracidovorax citrulli]|uniref:RusA family crossover junction endodeoxyribonuclease n=1 Tax=Paracidovorax citrulli TaxID=80869 RepID=UPI003A800CB9
MITFEIPGDPVAKARPRAAMVGGHARLYTPAKTEKYEARVAVFGQQAMAGCPAFTGPVALSVTALFSIPPSWPKKRQAAARAGTELHTKKPDLDNVIKAIKDGLNGIVWADDSQVAVLRECRKAYSDKPRVIVHVESALAQCEGQGELLGALLA